MRPNEIRHRRYPFTGRKVPVYGGRGTGLRGERHRFPGRRVPVYGAPEKRPARVYEIGLHASVRADSRLLRTEPRLKGTGFQGGRVPLYGVAPERDRFTGRRSPLAAPCGPIRLRKVPVYGAAPERHHFSG